MKYVIFVHKISYLDGTYGQKIFFFFSELLKWEILLLYYVYIFSDQVYWLSWIDASTFFYTNTTIVVNQYVEGRYLAF